MSYVLSLFAAAVKLLDTSTQGAKGYRTYAAYAASACAAVATIAGLVPGTSGIAVAVLCTALGGVFHRFAVMDHDVQLSDLTTGYNDIVAAVQKYEEMTGVSILPKPSPQPDEPDTLKFPAPSSSATTTALLLFVLAIGTTAIAAPPRAVIEGPDPSISGEILVLDASSSEGQPTSYSWEITPEIKGRRNVLQIDGGKKVVAHTFPGTYLVELIVSNAEGHSRAVRQINIPGNPPPSPAPQPVPPQPIPQPVVPTPTPVPPAPVPTPTPNPAPAPTPEPLSDIAQAVYAVAQAVNSPNRAAEATCLANGCQSLASALKAGKYSGSALAIGQGAVKDLGDTMDRCATPAWLSAREQFAAKIEQLYKEGKLKTADDWANIVTQIEQGLRRVK